MVVSLYKRLRAFFVDERSVDGSSIDINRAGEAIESFLRDRVRVNLEDFAVDLPKSKGVTTGFHARRLDDDAMHLVKVAPKGKSDHPDTYTFKQEYVASEILRRILFQRVSTVELMTLTTSDQGKSSFSPDDFVAMRTKFLSEFTDLSAGTNPEERGAFIDSRRGQSSSAGAERKHIKGFGKILASVLFINDIDWKSDNVGLFTNPSSGEVEYAKIDHGCCMLDLGLQSGEELLQLLRNKLQSSGYPIDLDISLTEMRETIEQISQISEAELNLIIDRRLKDLKDAGIDIDVEQERTEMLGVLLRQQELLQELDKILGVIQDRSLDEEFRTREGTAMSQEGFLNYGWMQFIREGRMDIAELAEQARTAPPPRQEEKATRSASEDKQPKSTSLSPQQRLQNAELVVMESFKGIFVQGAKDIEDVKQRLKDPEYQQKFAVVVQESYTRYLGDHGKYLQNVNFLPAVTSMCDEFHNTITEIEESPKLSLGNRVLERLQSSLSKLFSIIKAKESEMGVEVRRPDDTLKKATHDILRKGKKIQSKGESFDVEQLDDMLDAVITTTQQRESSMRAR